MEFLSFHLIDRNSIKFNLSKAPLFSELVQLLYMAEFSTSFSWHWRHLGGVILRTVVVERKGCSCIDNVRDILSAGNCVGRSNSGEIWSTGYLGDCRGVKYYFNEPFRSALPEFAIGS